MNCIAFGTKAETLQNLQREGLPIPELLYFTIRRWECEREKILNDIQNVFSSGLVVVRSSALIEDGGKSSMAGTYGSLLNVAASDRNILSEAISCVAATYFGNPEDQVLIQSMIENAQVSGVITTRCIKSGSPYYVVNYDDVSGRTDSVTGGVGVSKAVYVYHGVHCSDFDSRRLRLMLNFTKRLEKYFDDVPLDIEFGMDESEHMHLFQVRRICTQDRWIANVDQYVTERIEYVESIVKGCLSPKSGTLGSRSILGVMPDWNPAEIIGVTPRPLAVSLFRKVITKQVWAISREEMGYRNMAHAELMVMVAGRPYIDIRKSFNSFLPDGLSDAIGTKLVDAWLDRLESHPELHDKVEFEIAHTVHDLNFDASFKNRYPDLLTKNEFEAFKQHLLFLTNNNLKLRGGGSLSRAEADIKKLEKLQNMREINLEDLSPLAILDRVSFLLDECINLGTRPFAILARHAFIAEVFLRSIIEKGALEEVRVGYFKRNIRSISGQLVSDFNDVELGEMDLSTFMKSYGHLRPNTYDILTPCYLKRSDLFNEAASRRSVAQKCSPEFILSKAEKEAIDKLIRKNAVKHLDAEGLMEYISRAVSGREYAKFIFTKNISAVLEGITSWGKHLGFDRDELSFLSIDEILESSNLTADHKVREFFQVQIERRRRLSIMDESLKLSYIIRSPRDVYVVPQHRSAPNFITSDCVEAEVLVLDHFNTDSRFENRIVCIKNADPGYEWIFAKHIAGLITKYGGVNSHMAIRCAEFGLPAAIGCGDYIFEKLLSAKRCELNARDKSIRAL